MLKTILLVEDNEAQRNLMQEAFSEANLEVELHIVERAEELMAFLRKQGGFKNAASPDLVLLDLNLPGKSGLEALSEIKSDTQIKHVPIAVLTGSNASSDIQACAKFQCKYLLKPSGFNQLVQLVKSLPDLC